MNRLARTDININWRALNAAGNFGPGRYPPRDRLSGVWLVMLIAGLAILYAAWALR